MRLLVLATVIVVAACGSPKDTAVPKDLEKMESVKPALEKLTAEERELFAGYVVRHTIGAKLGGLFGMKEAGGIPDGMTIGKAIDEQRQFNADQAAEQAKQAALKQKLQAEREVATKAMRDAVTVTLISKRIKPQYSGDILLDELFEVSFGYRNNTSKDISGVKGRVSVRDLFGDEISAFQISNDNTIRAGRDNTWRGSRSVKYSFGPNHDRKLAELSEDKYKVVWEPQTIVFSDGSKMASPE